MVHLFFSLLLVCSTATSPETIAITNEGKIVTIIPKSEFHSSIFDEIIVEDQAYKAFLNNLENIITKQPRNAYLDNYQINPGKNGYKLDKFEFQRQFLAYYYKSGSYRLEAPKLTLYPRIDSELLDSIRQKSIGLYITYFNSRNNQRSHNIRLAAEAINNHVVFPGETFSFNNVVGMRTTERGYLPAPVIVKGELTEGIGGGICQVSSTLFNAADQAGMTIVQRYSHSKQVPYVPPGRDATVSWYGPDFTFVNPYNQPILIQARASLTIV